MVKQGLSYQVIQRLSTDQANYLDVLITAKQSGQDTVVDIDTLIARGSPSNASYNKVLKDIAQLRRMLDKNNVYIKSLSGKGFYLSDKVKTFKTKA